MRTVKLQLISYFTGEKFSDLAFLFRRGERTLSQAVFDTCEALFTTMKAEYLKVMYLVICLARNVTYNNNIKNEKSTFSCSPFIVNVKQHNINIKKCLECSSLNQIYYR